MASKVEHLVTPGRHWIPLVMDGPYVPHQLTFDFVILFR